MYFRQFLIETQTVSNQLKQFVRPDMREDFAKLKIKIVNMLERNQGMTPKLIQLSTNLILLDMMKELRTVFHAGLPANTAFGPIFDKLFVTSYRKFNNCIDYVIAKKDDNTALSKLNNADFTLQQLAADSEQWHQEIAERGKGPGPEGRTVLDLESIGWKKWKWVSLDRGYCKGEADAAGHCGNAGAVAGDNILSLRDPQNHVRLTFIVNDGILGEMKGRGNEKPAEKYHPAIVALLKSHLVKTVKGGGYAPDQNFHLNDLNAEHRDEVNKAKPNIEYITHVLASNDKKDYEELFGGERIERIEPDSVVMSTADSWEDLYSTIESRNVEDFSWLEDPHQHNDSYTPDVGSMLNYYISKENEQKLEDVLRSRLPEKSDDEDEDDEDEKDVEEMLEDDYEVKDAIESAGREAEEYGTEAEAYKDVQKQLGEPTENGFYVDFSKHPYEIKIDKKSIKDLWNSNDQDLSNLNDLYDFKYSPPYNGYSDFDKEHFNERLSELLDELK